ncbi:MAG: RNA methyltransferase [Clostridia bacterium]|nr:RNA methyltransferase [Clostridia bacterium]
MLITSAHNDIAVKIRQLSESRQRRAIGEYLVEGVKPVREAADAGCDIVSVICTPDRESEFKGATLFSEELFSRVSTEKTPQGVMAIVRIPDTKPRAPSSSCILLDGLQDCGNVGTIIRTANAAGYREIYLLNCADAFAPKTVRASMSGIFFARIMTGGRDEIFGALSDVTMVALDMNGENLYEFVPPPKFCLLVGNEGNGISDDTMSKAKYKVSIPMDKTCESLNASVAAGIAMYHLKNIK